METRKKEMYLDWKDDLAKRKIVEMYMDWDNTMSEGRKQRAEDKAEIKRLLSVMSISKEELVDLLVKETTDISGPFAELQESTTRIFGRTFIKQHS